MNQIEIVQLLLNQKFINLYVENIDGLNPMQCAETEQMQKLFAQKVKQ